MNLFIVFIISAIFAEEYNRGKYWAYNKCSEPGLSDVLKILYIVIDTFKDMAFLYCLLKCLLYGM